MQNVNVIEHLLENAPINVKQYQNNKAYIYLSN